MVLGESARAWMTVLGPVAIVATACGQGLPNPVAQHVSPASNARLSAVPTAGLLTPSPDPSIPDCSAINPTHALAIVWMSDRTTVYIRDVTDVIHPANICGFANLGAPPRFVTATTVSVATQFALYELDLKMRTRLPIADLPSSSDPHPPEIVEYDVSADGMTAAYAVWNERDAFTFHIVQGGIDKVLATVSYPPSVSRWGARVEFSPSGTYLALGASGGSGTSESAPVQVRTLDGRLVFSAAGTASLTWAGSGDHLYFDSGTGIRRWDGGTTTASVISGSWIRSNASPDRLHIAYDNFAAMTTQVLDVQSGARISLGLSGDPVFLTSRLILHTHFERCPTCVGGPGPFKTEERIYDLSDGTDVKSSLASVFSTWPRGTPARTESV